MRQEQITATTVEFVQDIDNCQVDVLNYWLQLGEFYVTNNVTRMQVQRAAEATADYVSISLAPKTIANYAGYAIAFVKRYRSADAAGDAINEHNECRQAKNRKVQMSLQNLHRDMLGKGADEVEEQPDEQPDDESTDESTDVEKLTTDADRAAAILGILSSMEDVDELTIIAHAVKHKVHALQQQLVAA